MINIQAGGFYNYNYQAIIITLFLRLQSKSNAHNVWFSGVPDKDKDNTVAMYVYFIK
jgi:hypothetical protein